MVDEPDRGPIPERRSFERQLSEAIAIVLRDSDMMRFGSTGLLNDVTPVGVGLILDEPLPLGEHVKLRLRNAVQKFEKEARGVVRHSTPRDDERFQIGVELFQRLTPLDVNLLRMGIRADKEDSGESSSES